VAKTEKLQFYGAQSLIIPRPKIFSRSLHKTKFIIYLMPDMEQKFVEVDGFSIAYVEKNPNAHQIIFFIHGNSGSSATWQKQMNDPLLSEYRQIAFDLPGHGASSNSSNAEEDYTPVNTAKILAEGVSLLSNAAPYILVGISYGTNIIAEMINLGIIPSGIVLMGLCCLGKNFGMDKVFKQMDTPNIYVYNEKDRNKAECFMVSFVESPNDVKSLVDDYFETDEQFKPTLMKAAAEGKFVDEIGALGKTGIPICIVNGALDKMFYPDYIKNSNLDFWKGNITILKNAGHFVHLDKPVEVNQIISAYAKEVFRSGHAS
jgi:pimeloyl-ACP methyl ester carboxylesterase